MLLNYDISIVLVPFFNLVLVTLGRYKIVIPFSTLACTSSKTIFSGKLKDLKNLVVWYSLEIYSPFSFLFSIFLSPFISNVVSFNVIVKSFFVNPGVDNSYLYYHSSS